MTNTLITAGTIVTHAVIGCHWKVVCGDDEYSMLKPFDNEAVAYMDSRDTVSMLVSRDTVSMLVSNEYLIPVDLIPCNTLVKIDGTSGVWRITDTIIRFDSKRYYAIPFDDDAIAYAINESVFCLLVSESEFKRFGFIDEVVDGGAKA